MGSTFTLKVLKNFIAIPSTVELRYNEGPRDWQNLFAITRFRYRYLEFRYVEVTLKTINVSSTILFFSFSLSELGDSSSLKS